MYSGDAVFSSHEHRVVATPAHCRGDTQRYSNEGDDDDVEERRDTQERFEVLNRTEYNRKTQKSRVRGRKQILLICAVNAPTYTVTQIVAGQAVRFYLTKYIRKAVRMSFFLSTDLKAQLYANRRSYI